MTRYARGMLGLMVGCVFMLEGLILHLIDILLSPV